MAFNWGRAFTGGAKGALAGYSSVLQGQMEKEWYAEQQAMMEQREKSLYDYRRNAEAGDRALAAEQTEAQIAASKASTAATVAATEQNKEQFDYTKGQREKQDKLEGNAQILVRDNKTNEIISVSKNEYLENTQSYSQLDPVEALKYTKRIENELTQEFTAENKEKEFDALIKNRDKVVAEFKKLGGTEEEANALAVSITTGIKLEKKEGLSVTDKSKMIDDSYQEKVKLFEEREGRSATPEEKKVMMQSSISENNIIEGAAGGGRNKKVTAEEIAAQAIADGATRPQLVQQYGEAAANKIWGIMQKDSGSTEGALVQPSPSPIDYTGGKERAREASQRYQANKESAPIIANIKSEMSDLARKSKSGTITPKERQRLDELKRELKSFN